MEGEELVLSSKGATGNKDGYLALLSQNSHYVIQGTWTADFDANLETVKSITQSLKRK